MPNGGEHYERLGACPLCGSLRIRIRRQRHRRLLWRCRRCNGVFRTPKVAAPGDEGKVIFRRIDPSACTCARCAGGSGGRCGRRTHVGGYEWKQTVSQGVTLWIR